MATANSITVTALDIITAALQEIGALAPGETPSNEDQAWVLQKLQRLIDRYNARLPMIYNVNFTTFTLPNGPNPVTIGPGGTFDVNQRPQSIPSIGLILPGTVGVELPLNSRDQDWWANNRIKGLTSTLPTDYYYSPDWPMGNIFFWPVPAGKSSGPVSQTIVGEVPAGFINGTNTVFTLAQVPTGTVWLFLNGLYQTPGSDYTIAGKIITFTAAPTGTLSADYVVGSASGATISPSQTPDGVIDGTNTVFTLSDTPTGAVFIFVNGVYQSEDVDYTLDGSTVTFTVAPTGIVTADYVLDGGPTSVAPSETPAGVINGVNTTFTLSRTPTGTIWLFVNGVYQTLGTDFTVVERTINFAVAPTGAMSAAYVYGTPADIAAGSYQVNVQTRQVLGEYTTYGGSFSMPPAYWDAIVYELAISIGPSFSREAGSTLVGLWKASIKSIQVNNITSPRLSSDAPSQPTGRPDFNFLDGLTR